METGGRFPNMWSKLLAPGLEKSRGEGEKAAGKSAEEKGQTTRGPAVPLPVQPSSTSPSRPVAFFFPPSLFPFPSPFSPHTAWPAAAAFCCVCVHVYVSTDGRNSTQNEEPSDRQT